MSFDPDAPAQGDGLFGLPADPHARIGVIPVPWQATTSYRRGTREGPSNVRQSSLQVDLQDVEYGDFWRAGIALQEEDPEIAAWDAEVEADALAVIEAGGASESDAAAAAAARVNARGEQLNAKVYAAVKALLGEGKIPAVLGGDHSVPFGAIQAVAEAHPGVGVLHIDAHADLREAYEGFTWSHASIFYNVLDKIEGVAKLVQVGIRDVGSREVALSQRDERVHTFFDADLAMERMDGVTWMKQVQRIVSALPEEVYISFDIDGLDPALCPGTGTPVPGGLSFHEVCALLRAVSRSRRVVGFDLNEVGPGEWDGVVGARIFYKLCGCAIRSDERARAQRG